MKRQFFPRQADARPVMAAAWRHVEQILQSNPGARVTVEPLRPTRTTDQNRCMWACLSDIAEQVQWPVDGALCRLEPEEWKHVLSAGLKQHQRVAQGINGGYVILGQRTSRMTVSEMGDLIDLCHAFGSERGVRWSDLASQGRAAA